MNRTRDPNKPDPGDGANLELTPSMQSQPPAPRPKGLAGVAYDIAYGDIDEKDKRCLFVLRWGVVLLAPLFFSMFGAWMRGEELDPEYVRRIAESFGTVLACPECPEYAAPTLICPPWPGDGKPIELETP